MAVQKKESEVVEPEAEGRVLTFEVDGEPFEVNALEWEDPTEDTLYYIERIDNKTSRADIYQLVRQLGVDPSGWRLSKVYRFLDELRTASKLDEGKSDGSDTSSEPTKKKSSTR